jgi:hypothetical protein
MDLGRLCRGKEIILPVEQVRSLDRITSASSSGFQDAQNAENPPSRSNPSTSGRAVLLPVTSIT